MKMKKNYFALALFVCVFFSCDKETTEDTTFLEAENATAVENQLLDVVNDHRQSLGKSALEFSAIAYRAANQHTDYMISIGAINHDNFTARASKISSEVNVELVAENVAKDYDNAEEAFRGWLSSSSHRKTMEGDFSHTAISVKSNDAGKYYFTQVFYKAID